MTDKSMTDKSMTDKSMTDKSMTKEQGAPAKLRRASKQAVSPPMGGLRLTADFLSPIVVGIFLGFWLDRWSGMTPLFLLLLFFLGVLAGFWNLYRMAQRIDEHNRAADASSEALKD